MRELSAATRVLDEMKGTSVVEVHLAGDVESLQGGISSLVESILSETPVAGLVFDLTDLRYVSWDDIGIPSIVVATNRSSRPCCLFSKGRNRKNLGSLLEVTGLGAFLGGQVFADFAVALKHIREALGAESAKHLTAAGAGESSQCDVPALLS